MTEKKRKAAVLLAASLLGLQAAGCAPKKASQNLENEKRQTQPEKAEAPSEKEEADSRQTPGQASENPSENPLWQEEDNAGSTPPGKDGPPDAELNPPVRRS